MLYGFYLLINFSTSAQAEHKLSKRQCLLLKTIKLLILTQLIRGI